MEETRKKKKLTGKAVAPYIFSLPFIICVTMFVLYPTAYSLWASFQEWNGFTAPTFIGLQNYIRIFTSDSLYWKSLGNTFILMGISTPATVFLGLVLAYVLFNLKKSKRFFQTVSFYPYIIMPVAIGFIFSYLFDWQTGFINKVLEMLGVVEEPFYWLQNAVAGKAIVIIMIIWRYLGYYAMLFLSSMTSISPDIYDAAKVDGSSSWNTFWKVTVPILRSTIIFLAITSVIGGLKMFEEPQILYSGWSTSSSGATGGPGNTVLTVMWKFYNDAYKLNSRMGYAAAESYVLFVITVVITLFLNRITRRKSED